MGLMTWAHPLNWSFAVNHAHLSEIGTNGPMITDLV